MAKRASGKKAAGRRTATKRTSPRRTAAKAAKRPPAKRTVGSKTARRRTTPSSKRAPAPPRKAVRAAGKPKVRRSRPAAKAARPHQASAPLTTAVRGTVAGAIAAVADKLPWTTGGTDAITLLEADHRRMEDLLAQGEQTSARGAKKRTELLNTLTRELNAHELIEEKVLYPALQSHPEAKDIVLEGYQEHHVADLIVDELHGLARDDEQWGPKFKVLKENIEHHIQEEEGEMFRTARGLFSREQLQELGTTMARMKAAALPGRKA